MAYIDYVERKGSLFLRSEHMNYSRATLNSNWHQARESEPKDYNISKDPQRDLCKATYDRIGNVTQGELPHTTYRDFSEQIFQKEDFSEKESKKSMINEETASHVNLDRETGTPQSGYGAVLPRHHPDHNKCHFETTNKSDYKPPVPFTPAEEKPPEFDDYSLAHKKCNSQFTDTADYRRGGRNTWQDESGVYHNTHHKQECPTYTPTNPLAAMMNLP